MRHQLNRGCDRYGFTGLETLEPRVLLDALPYPTIDLLETSSNPVVRFVTAEGEIDIELFADVAPNTVANFLEYVRQGDYDETFFHRRATDESAGVEVLQGGAFRFDDTAGLRRVDQRDPIENEFSRSNVRWTVAMARLGGNADSATNQFFFNVQDNVVLDTIDGGFTVFGVVLDNGSRESVLAISGEPRGDFRDIMRTFTGVPQTDPFGNVIPISGADPNSLALSETPVTMVPTFPNGSAMRSDFLDEDILKYIFDAEVIKPQGTVEFFTERAFYPEGFSGSTINEFLPVGNPHAKRVWYQVIARAETDRTSLGMFRDRVVFSGSINANRRGGITISRFTVPAENLLPQGVPYSLELWSTEPLVATLSHYDFDTATGESFVTELATEWAFAEGLKDSGQQFDFLVWSNPDNVRARVEVTFYFESGGPQTIVSFTDPYRRGGLNLSQVTIIPEDAPFAAVVTSDVPIVAAMTRFDVTGDRNGSTSIGVAQAASPIGIVPTAVGGSGIGQEFTVLNTSGNTAIVSLTLSFTDPARSDVVLNARLIVPSNRRDSFDLGPLAAVADGATFSIRYSTLADVPIYATITSTRLMDSVSTPAAVQAATRIGFAEGFMNRDRAGIDVFETLAIYNPNSAVITGANNPANVTIKFYYTDGFTITSAFTIDPGERLELDLHEFQPILDENENNRFFYSIDVTSDLPIVAQMNHYDLTLGDLQPSGGFTTLGTLFGGITRLDELLPPA